MKYSKHTVGWSNRVAWACHPAEGVVPNGIVSGGDILRAVSGFAGTSFGSGVTGCLSGTCVPPQGGICE